MLRKAYPKYKPSGVEWLGDVPEHWEISPLKFVCRLAYGDSLSAEDREDGDYAVYGSNGAVGTHNKANTLAPVIIVGRKGSYGKLNFSDKPVFSIDTTYFIDNRFTKQSLLWLKYALQPLNLDEGSKDSAVPGLAREDAYINKIPLPPLPEQQAIAAFLDRETWRIDALITKKERLLELLAEQRTALISRAVTKGLDASVKLKPSGVEWLGDVPEHWETWKLAHGFDLVSSGTTPPSDELEWYDGTIPWITTSELRENLISSTEKCVTKEAVSRFSALKIFPKGSLAIAMYGATIGRLGILGLEATTNQACCVMNGGQVFSVNFVYFWMQAFKESIILLASGGGQPNISQDKIRSLKIPCPSVTEQQAIAAFLERETSKIDALSAKVTTVIERLKEYRTALISSAVTGKIDVSTTLNTSVKATT